MVPGVGRMISRTDELPAILTCFAYRHQYFAEMDGMVATVREHHPDWPIVVGRGPVPGREAGTFEVESPLGMRQWTVPVPLKLDGSQDDWFRIVMIKAWWIAQVWNLCDAIGVTVPNRVVWADADARFNGALDIELDPDAEVIAGPWWYDPENFDHDTICSGLLLFQGARNGRVATIIDQWSDKCLSYIQTLPPKTKPWPDGDQEALTDVLKLHPNFNGDYVLLKLEHEKYVGSPTRSGKLARRALVDSWYMSEKMKAPECHGLDWPPPEEYRLRAAIGTPLPGWRPYEEPPDVIWSIGIYSGDTLFDLAPAPGIENPVIAAKDVTDVEAEFVADPFMIKGEETWHMFFEVMNAKTQKGEIGWATSPDGLAWTYRQIVLRESFHMSYPYVFSIDGEYYMVPETGEAKSIRLYKGDPFPDRWSLVGVIKDGVWADSSLFYFGDRWWMFSCPKGGRLDLLHAEGIHGPWHSHPMNPIVDGDNRIARPGGRVIVLGDKIIRFPQDCHPYYGTQVRAFEISELTASDYREREVEGSPILSRGASTWNRSGMHHVDPHLVNGRWLACVDGWRFEKPDAQGRG